MNAYPGRYGKGTWRHLQQVQHFGYAFSSVFSDFVDVCLAALLSLTENLKYADVAERLSENRMTGPYEERYMQIVGRYKENADRPVGQRPADFFASAWGALQVETQQAEQDVLGDIYESTISLGEHGQFFTPSAVCDMMAQMVGTGDGETVSDPACGSGRLFISAAKQNKHLHFVGVDVSPVCARMCALNMWLFHLYADVYQGNSLSMEMRYVWCIRPGGLLFETKIDHTASVSSSLEVSAPAMVQPEQPKKKRSEGASAPLQQTLFDFDT